MPQQKNRPGQKRKADALAKTSRYLAVKLIALIQPNSLPNK